MESQCTGKWDTLAIGGSGLVWLGEYSAYPSSPQNGDAFYRTLLGNSYVYNGSSWELLARRGSDGRTAYLIGLEVSLFLQRTLKMAGHTTMTQTGYPIFSPTGNGRFFLMMVKA